MRRSDKSQFKDWTIGKCIQFAEKLEQNERFLAENAAMGVTCAEFDLEIDEGYEALLALPYGRWWEIPE